MYSRNAEWNMHLGDFWWRYLHEEKLEKYTLKFFWYYGFLTKNRKLNFVDDIRKAN